MNFMSFTLNNAQGLRALKALKAISTCVHRNTRMIHVHRNKRLENTEIVFNFK